MLHMTREDPANEVVWDHLSRIAQPDFGQIKAQLLIQKVFLVIHWFRIVDCALDHFLFHRLVSAQIEDQRMFG